MRLNIKVPEKTRAQLRPRGGIRPMALAVSLALSFGNANAGAITDGTAGPLQSLSGDMLIPESLGTSAGGNLFHSFSRFNIDAGESATFTADSLYNNVITRVTGQTPSVLAGPLTMQAPGSPAFYFLNPAGVVFGEGFSVNVPGSFRVTTADYLGFEDGAILETDLSEISTFSSAPPQNYGFTGDQSGTITIDPFAEIVYEKNQIFDLIGGDIQFDGYVAFGQGDFSVVAFGQTKGEIDVIDLASSALPTGTVTMNSGVVDTTIFEDGVDLGRFFAFGGSMKASDVAIILFTDGSGRAGDVFLNMADSIELNDFSVISTAGDVGNGGDIFMSASNILIDQGSLVYAETYDTGSSGNVSVVAETLTLNNGSEISSSTLANGSAGLVVVEVDSLNILNTQGGETLSGIYSDALDNGDPDHTGDAGLVDIVALKEINLNGGFISSTTFTEGFGGQVFIETPRLNISGLDSGIFAQASELSGGLAGDMDVTVTDTLRIENGGGISLENFAATLTDRNIGPGFLTVTAPVIIMNDGYISTSSFGDIDASDIFVEFGRFFHMNPGQISSTAQDGNGGNIEILGQGMLLMDNASIVTSVLGLQGDGGNISINAEALVLDTGFIQANTTADGALGGDITIDVPAFTTTGGLLSLGGDQQIDFQPDIFGFNVIQAAAADGINGDIQITSVGIDESGLISVLNASPLKDAELGRNPCQAVQGSSLSEEGYALLPTRAEGLLSMNGLRVSASKINDWARNPSSNCTQ